MRKALVCGMVLMGILAMQVFVGCAASTGGTEASIKAPKKPVAISTGAPVKPANRPATTATGATTPGQPARPAGAPEPTVVAPEPGKTLTVNTAVSAAINQRKTRRIAPAGAAHGK